MILLCTSNKSDDDDDDFKTTVLKLCLDACHPQHLIAFSLVSLSNI